MKAKVVAGKGEGARYVEVYAQKIKKLTGIVPFHGTLNLDVGFIPPLEVEEIEAFGEFGAVEIAPCAVNFERAFAVFPEKGKNREEGIVEVIAEKNLKEALGLKEGSFVDLQF